MFGGSLRLALVGLACAIAVGSSGAQTGDSLRSPLLRSLGRGAWGHGVARVDR